MRQINAISLIMTSLLLSTSSNQNLTNESKVIFYQNPYFIKAMKPFEKSIDVGFYYYTSHKNYTEYIYLYDGDGYLSYSTYGKNRQVSNGYIYFEASLPFDLYYDQKGVDVQIVLKDNLTNKNIYDKRLHLNGLKQTSIIASKYRETPYVIPCMALDFINGKSLNESFDFSKIEGTITNDGRSRLLVNNISFQYSFVQTMNCGEAYLVTEDPKDVFCYIPRVNNLKRIPLSALPNLNNVSFLYKKMMYVHPQTLDMSLNPRDGFKETYNFYLPIDGYQKLKDYQFKIEMYNCGINEINITIPLTFVKDRDVNGNCTNSDFCVIGGVKS